MTISVFALNSRNVGPYSKIEFYAGCALFSLKMTFLSCIFAAAFEAVLVLFSHDGSFVDCHSIGENMVQVSKQCF